MLKIDLPVLVGKLHPIVKSVLEDVAADSINAQITEITLPHLFKQLFATPLCDVRLIAENFELEIGTLIDAFELEVTQMKGKGGIEDYPRFSPLLVELLQDAWLLASAEMKQTELRSGVLFLALLLSSHRYLPHHLSQQFITINRELLKRDWLLITAPSAEAPNVAKNPANPTACSPTLLAKYAQDVTALAKQEQLDPVLCRDNEMDLMIDILCRRRKNNPIIVGEAGVGKSALIEGLALRIVNGEVPDKLCDTRIMSLDLGALQAGAAVKGEFEKRFKGVMAEIDQSPIPIILFIDEAHTLIGAGNQQGGLDVSNLLKPALARGTLKTIAATTWKEYKKYVEKDAALSRRFQLVKLNEPTVDEAIIIIQGLRLTYEQAHSVLIDEEAVISAARLSDRYLSGRQLPDKAIDVLDTACARVAIALTSPPKALSHLRTQIHQLATEKTLFERAYRLGMSNDAERLAALTNQIDTLSYEQTLLEEKWHQQQELVKQIIAARQQLLEKEGNDDSDTGSLRATLQSLEIALSDAQKDQILVSPHVTKSQIETVIAEWTGVPLERLSQNELNIIADLPTYLSKEIKGQTLAIKHLHRHLLTARADLRRQGRPLGAFLLVGPSGVGKTESVLQITNLLFGGKQYLTTINMSEFQEKHTVSRLIGSPPGYVGYGEGGILTEAIRRMPYSVVLLDEVEKAHPDVLNLFYQAFDKGEMADGEGRLIDCQNVVFFLTSNLGYQTIVDNAENESQLTTLLYPELAAFFKPALLARMEVIPFLPLSQTILADIIDGKLSTLTARLIERFNTSVTIDDDVKTEILLRANRAENGARMLESIIDGHMLPPISLLLLQKQAQNMPIEAIRFSVVDHQFVAAIGEEQCDFAI
ncbi:type VI secretion system ATPase TssH [Muribacter muris]|uniref:Type VI secretion system ATPase TssH n=1 Tax=Muribacter muris TaxID=67855 RepID=A0A4Y9JXB5_9PAST|nr:type VI secretion system ATPase TssH [Muribacter muris]MBF0785581.1 type VI secretion system ATPase TssH [Muribacter muris]MBF0827997.1 type VI secretion system ATPase TssH [Muribacter muris]TFV09076.1 type VI secretion system ATPase TssH [Muribacter muris]